MRSHDRWFVFQHNKSHLIDSSPYYLIFILILEPAFRRQGHALSALRLLLLYACQPRPAEALPSNKLPVSPASLVVRIGASNAPSIALFTRLGFGVSKRVDVFDEIEMRFGWDSARGKQIGVEEKRKAWAEGGEVKEVVYDG